MLYPQEDAEELNTNLEVPRDKVGNNLLDAISLGTTDGVRLAVNVGAMLLVFIALIALLNGMLGWAGDVSGLNLWINYQSGGQFSSLSLESILGFAFAPVSWLLGVPNPDLMIVGTLLGHALCARERPDQSFDAALAVSRTARGVKGTRGDAADAVHDLLALME